MKGDPPTRVACDESLAEESLYQWRDSSLGSQLAVMLPPGQLDRTTWDTVCAQGSRQYPVPGIHAMLEDSGTGKTYRQYCLQIECLLAI